MPVFVRVTDDVKPRREYSIPESAVDPDVHTVLDKLATKPDGTPLPPKYTPNTLAAASDGEGYEGLTVKALKQEIDRRNADRGEDAQISKAGNKPDLIAALDDDDNAQLLDQVDEVPDVAEDGLVPAGAADEESDGA